MTDGNYEKPRADEYGTSSDRVHDVIRRGRQREEAVAALQAAITEGLESGKAEGFDVDAFLLSMRRLNAPSPP